MRAHLYSDLPSPEIQVPQPEIHFPPPEINLPLPLLLPPLPLAPSKKGPSGTYITTKNIDEKKINSKI